MGSISTFIKNKYTVQPLSKFPGHILNILTFPFLGDKNKVGDAQVPQGYVIQCIINTLDFDVITTKEWVRRMLARETQFLSTESYRGLKLISHLNALTLTETSSFSFLSAFKWAPSTVSWKADKHFVIISVKATFACLCWKCTLCMSNNCDF